MGAWHQFLGSQFVQVKWAAVAVTMHLSASQGGKFVIYWRAV